MKEKLFDKSSCELCEMAIIAGNPELDPAMQKHLQECPACRDFARFQQSLLAMKAAVADTPSLESIKQENYRRKQYRRRMQLIVYPLAAAAAMTIAIGGIMFQMHSPAHPAPQVADYQIISDTTAFAAALEESSMLLAWDQATYREQQCVKSMRAAQNGNNPWNIELFNPYSEE